jgi:acyl-CoA synthetase (AMP-forming)/AMP-acid ligase II
LFYQAARIPTRLALCAPPPAATSLAPPPRAWTYAELWRDARAVSRAVLAAHGGGAPVEAGHAVALLLPHCEAYVLALFGVWYAGGAVFPLETNYTPSLIAEASAAPSLRRQHTSAR